jgi:hypothetical protein
LPLRKLKLAERRRAPEPAGPGTIPRELRWRMTLKEGEHGLWTRLKACRNPPCSVVFYDNSKNQSRVWHNTSDCGNLVNLRAARVRQREQAS